MSEASAQVDEEVGHLIEISSVKAIASRKLSQETCRKFNYRVRLNNTGQQLHVAVYCDVHGQPAWVKTRNTGTAEKPLKEFFITGDADDRFFGQHLWSAGGKRLVIVGGEIDCMTVSQAQDNQWPVVSPPKGEKGITKSIKAQYEWVNSFDEIVLGLDMDGPGREANLEAAAMLPPGKVKIATWTRKDPNEMLLQGEGKEIVRAIWNAQPYHPDGIIDAREVSLEPPAMGLPWPWKPMTEWTLGRRPGEVITLGSGTGMGKSDTLYELVACDVQGKNAEGETWEPQKWGVFSYESGASKTKKEILSKIAGKRFKIPPGHHKCNWVQADLDAAKAVLDVQCGGRLFLMDGKGAPDWERIKDLARFLRQAHDVKHFAVDPVSALVAGEDDERKMLDKIFLEAENITVELDATFYFYCHLTRPREGPSHEEGGQVRLSQFRGSNGIGMSSSFVMGYERNQQADQPDERCKATIRMVKDRLLGDSTGEKFSLFYNRQNGHLERCFEDIAADEEDVPL